MPKHIRHQSKQHKREGFFSRVEEQLRPFGLTNKHLTVIAIILFILLAHCMGWITLPTCIADILPGKSAPASHLQYFFF